MPPHIKKQIDIEHYDHGKALYWRAIENIFKWWVCAVFGLWLIAAVLFFTDWHNFFSNSFLATPLRWLGVL